MKSWPFCDASNPSHSSVNPSFDAARRRLSDERRRIRHAQSSLLSVAARELRSPLMQLQGYASMLDQMTEAGDLSPQQAAAMVQGIAQGTALLRRAVEKTLDAMALEANALELAKQPFSPIKLVRKALESLRDEILARGMIIDTWGIDDLPKIHGDWERLYEAVVCILANCVAYTVNGGRVAVRGLLSEPTVQQRLDTPRMVRISIHDTSPGLCQPQGDTLLDQACKAVKRGLGVEGPLQRLATLEMVTARGVIEAHGGRLVVTATEHDPVRCPGIIFEIDLPVR